LARPSLLSQFAGKQGCGDSSLLESRVAKIDTRAGHGWGDSPSILAYARLKSKGTITFPNSKMIVFTILASLWRRAEI
jgi:hypothetical protein